MNRDSFQKDFLGDFQKKFLESFQLEFLEDSQKQLLEDIQKEHLEPGCQPEGNSGRFPKRTLGGNAVENPREITKLTPADAVEEYIIQLMDDFQKKLS